MYIEAKNRISGKTILARLRERGTIELRKKIRIPNTNARKTA